jgi:hypothetical protein
VQFQILLLRPSEESPKYENGEIALCGTTAPETVQPQLFVSVLSLFRVLWNLLVGPLSSLLANLHRRIGVSSPNGINNKIPNYCLVLIICTKVRKIYFA